MSLVSTNKFNLIPFKYLKRFDGTTVKTEPSSQFSHQFVGALGSYRKSAFVTGTYHPINGLKTEILDYRAKQWNQVDDFPTSNGDRLYKNPTKI